MKIKMKRLFSLAAAAALVLTFAACSSNSSSGKDSPGYNSSMEKNDLSFAVVQKKDLTEMEGTGKYAVKMGNMPLYDSLLMRNKSTDIKSIKESSEYKRLAKVGVAFQDKTDDAGLALLESSYLYSKGTAYQPYYLLARDSSYGTKVILLFECEDKLADNLVFTERDDGKIVISSIPDAGKAAESDLSNLHNNKYSECYNARDSKNADTYFETGNSSYNDTDFEKAECNYLLALNNSLSLSAYTKNDVKNNLVLARLQLEKNEDAFKMACELVSNNPIKDGASEDELKNSTGYVINLLVAAHANKISKNSALDKVKNVTLTEVDSKLKKLADDNPGEFVRFMTALTYNENYIEMEESDNKTNLERIQSSLDELNKKEKKTFDKEDEDIKELKEYLSAKIDSLK